MTQNEIIENAYEFLQQLRDLTGETVGLAVLNLEKFEGIVIDSIAGSHSFNFLPEVGHRFPPHCTGPGKALLAALSADQLTQYFDCTTLTKDTPYTLSNREELKADLKKIRDCGYSLDMEEAVEGLRCIGAVVRDKTLQSVAAIWVTGPISRVKKEKLTEFAAHVCHTAERISERLCGNSYNPEKHISYVVDKAREFLWDHVEEKVNVEDLANELHVGYCWFRRNFKKQTGMSPNQYHMDLKLKKAKRMLKHTELTVKEIANQLGYRTQDYFSSIFKKKEGEYPQHYRKQHRRHAIPKDDELMD